MIIQETDKGMYRCSKGINTGACLGALCMAWRWASVQNPDYVRQHVMAYPPPLPWENSPVIKSTTHGYCGLGGQP